MPATPSFYGGVTIHVFRDREGNLPGSTPRKNIVRAPTVGGGENVQVLGNLPAEWILDLELDSPAYAVFSTMMHGTSQELNINGASYGFWFLEEISRVQRDPEHQSVRCTVRFMEDN